MTHSALGIVSLGGSEADRALAERLFESLRNLILDGVWRHGDKLPGTRVIARDAGVSRWTAVVAVDMLIASGLVEARKRSGTYVAWKGGSRSPDLAPASEKSFANAPFALGLPALELFPMPAWRRLQSRRWRQMPMSALEDGHAAGWPELRQAIADFAATVRGIQCSPDQIIVTSGVEAAGRLTGQVLCRPGAPVWIEDPGSRSTRAVATSAQLVPVCVPLDREGIDVDEGMRIAPGAAMAVVTPAVQFPIATRMSDARRRKLLSWADSSNAWILEIDHAAEFPCGRPSLASTSHNRVVYFDTFGKLLFPSLRVAYLIVPRDAAARFQAEAQLYDRPPPIPNQIILADFLTSGQFAKHLRRCKDAYAERRKALTDALALECGDLLSFEPNQAGLFVCARLPRDVDDVALAARARERGLAVTPLSQCYQRKTDDRGLVLGFAGHGVDKLRQSAATLGRVVEESVRRAEMVAAV